MKTQVAHQTMTCNTCHGAHRYERRTAAVTSCMNCHDDAHTRAYIDSPHHRLWQQELSGAIPRGQGVSCATCHMPTIEFKDEEGHGGLFVSHNPNDHLRPNAKMIRSSCIACHGMNFTLNALADPELIRRNFDRPPVDTEHPSLRMLRNKTAQRRNTATPKTSQADP